MPTCIVPGCVTEGLNNIGIRLRRPDTSAIWAPNTEAFICEAHAKRGATLHLFYVPREDDVVEVHVHGATPTASRTTRIKRREMTEDLTSRIRR
jgi:hypothetical protein